MVLFLLNKTILFIKESVLKCEGLELRHCEVRNNLCYSIIVVFKLRTDMLKLFAMYKLPC